jgi:hypothetical protein
MSLRNSPRPQRRRPIRGRKPNPQAGKTSRRRLVGHYRGALLRDATDPLRRPTATSGASGTFFRLSLARPARGFSLANGPAPSMTRREFPLRRAGAYGTEACCERRTIRPFDCAQGRGERSRTTSGRSRASVGRRQRERQKSRQVTDLPCNRQAAAAAVSPAVERFAVQHGSGPLFGRRCSY